MRSSIAFLLLTSVFAFGCEQTSETCSKQIRDLGDVCPVTHKPELVAEGSDECQGNASYGSGQAAGNGGCVSVGSCTVFCKEVPSPCDCGAKEVRKDRIICNEDCPESCGDGTCAKGETHRSCARDCEFDPDAESSGNDVDDVQETSRSLQEDTDSSSSACDEAANALRECGLLTEGDFGCSNVADDPTLECYFEECFSGASCSQLEELTCGAEGAVPDCIEYCFGYTCNDGTPLDTIAICDGYADCPDYEDELYCVSCASGEVIPEFWICDEYIDCSDASDESSCNYANAFVCDDGLQIPNSWICDQEADCSGGEDEDQDCPPAAELLCGE